VIPRSALLLLAAAALCGCGGTGRLAPETPPGANLAGTWKLNRQASDDPQAMLEQIQRKLMKQMRSRAYDENDGEFPSDDNPDESGPATQTGSRQRGGGQRSAGVERGTGDHGVRNGFMRRSSYAQALGPQLNSDSLTIEQTPTRLVFTRGDWRRSFTPGGQSVVSVADGVADQHSGWSGRDYVIEVKPQVGPRVIERYGLSADNRQLVEKMTLTEDGLPKLEFTRVYEPGTQGTRDVPTSN
jgi:hypothetical protein